MFEGVGRSIRELFTIFSRGCDFRRFGAIRFLGYRDSRITRMESADELR